MLRTVRECDFCHESLDYIRKCKCCGSDCCSCCSLKTYGLLLCNICYKKAEKHKAEILKHIKKMLDKEL